MADFKKKLFSYATFGKIFGHIFIVMEPKIFYHKLLEKQGKQEKADEFGYKAVKKWAKFVVNTAKVDITVEGLEKIPTDRPVLFTPNHQSYADVPILIHVLKDFNFGFLMRMQLNKLFAIEQISHILHCVPINQENPREGIKALHKTAEQIKMVCQWLFSPREKEASVTLLTNLKTVHLKLCRKQVLPLFLYT